MMNTITALWKPVWHELDQSLAIGEIGFFEFIKTLESLQFATALDKDGEEINVRILTINNAELGNIIKIDAVGLSYKFYTQNNDYIQIEAEEQPGLIEVGVKRGSIIKDTSFYVEVELVDSQSL